MPPKDRSRRSARRRPALAVEGLEARELLTVIARHVNHAAAAAAAAAQATTDPALVVPAPLPSNQDPNVSDPTPAELARQHFTLGLKGSFQTSRGRFANEPLQGLILATGGSNQSLHLNAQMQFFLYSIPGALPTGQIALTPKNTSTTGTLLLLDLTSDGSSSSHGLPTHYTWTVNSGSGGLYTNASGSGTLDVGYTFGRRPNGVNGLGKVTIKAQGSVVTSHALTLDISAPGNRVSRP